MIIRLLQKVTQSLEKADIPYMLSSSIALNRYSVPGMIPATCEKLIGAKPLI